MRIMHVVGARPNFVKASAVWAAIEELALAEQVLVHTGQHYDYNMSGAFFDELGLRLPDINLGVGSGSHAEQTANIMLRLERVVLHVRPDLVLVYGDVNSTLAAALVCAKLPVPVGHVEAGLRSGDRTMPEEINRLVTDCVADLLFTPSLDANVNLHREGVAPHKIHLVGNVVIDTLVRLLPAAERSTILVELGLRDHGCPPRPYIVVTMHRPSNVDMPERLCALLAALHEIGSCVPVVFPVHPRTAARIRSLGWTVDTTKVRLTDPMGYAQFLQLQKHAAAVITDSGGVQEETTYLGVPCVTVRTTTERPITVQLGTNHLLGDQIDQLPDVINAILRGEWKRGQVPPLWDGHAAKRIAQVLAAWWGQRQESRAVAGGLA